MRRYALRLATTATASATLTLPRLSPAPLQAATRHHSSRCGCHGGLSLPSSAVLTSSPSATAVSACTPHRHFSSSNSNSSGGNGGGNQETFADGTRAYVPGQSVTEKYPIVQMPARSLWCKQYALDPRHVKAGEFSDLIAQVKAARHYYQYPSLSAPQVGWNVQMFTLFDDTVYINPVNLDEEAWRAEAARRGVPWFTFEEEKLRELRQRGQTCFAWEPCASSGFTMHYIERPSSVRLRALDEGGKPVEVTLDRMRGRMALHELDHLQGVLFTRRVVDTDHVVPLQGFLSMSDWSDDYPSLEARSTFLYTLFTPPYHFVADSVPDGNLLDRKFEDCIYPGCEQERQQRIESAAAEELQRQQWRSEKKKQQRQREAAAQTAESDPDNAAGSSP